MLSKEDNEALCRVGPGTPMGDLIRQYWLPALRSDELPGPDGPPPPIRLPGENTAAHRATPESNLKSRGRTPAYPCRERTGVVCPYMGPRETPPLLPELEPFLLPQD